MFKYKSTTILKQSRIAVVTKDNNGWPVGSYIRQEPNTDTWVLADGSAEKTYFNTIGTDCEWIDTLITDRNQHIMTTRELLTNAVHGDYVEPISLNNMCAITGQPKIGEKYFVEYAINISHSHASLGINVANDHISTIQVNYPNDSNLWILHKQSYRHQQSQLPIQPTTKEPIMTIQAILSTLFGSEKPTTDYDRRPSILIVAYNRNGSEIGTATASSLAAVEERVAATPELWGCKVLTYVLDKEVSVKVPVKSTKATTAKEKEVIPAAE